MLERARLAAAAAKASPAKTAAAGADPLMAKYKAYKKTATIVAMAADDDA